jgi:hypothetical protein
MNHSCHVRSRRCGTVLPAWLPIPNAPECAMLLHHLADQHRTMQDMAVEALEAFAREHETQGT